MMCAKKLGLIFVVSLQLYYGLAQTVNLTIADGKIQGLISTTSRNNVTYFGFLGIPYAQPPLGDLRFANPVKSSPWNGVLNATRRRSGCLQSDSDSLSGDEDCLYINVFSPNLSATNLPVLVWIYGGSFVTGNTSYGPEYFLEQGLAVVSFDYRLGIFGFLSTQDEASPGNWGIKDQILALKWVQDNIAAFGGNPNNVTIFGQSAGAASVHLLMQTNLTQGLFHRAIMNSGTTLDLWALNTRAELIARSIGTNLGINTLNNTELVEKLRGVDAVTLQNTSSLISLSIYATNVFRGLPFALTMEPNINGSVYLNPSDSALREGKFHKVPVLMGFTSNEASYFTSLASLIKVYSAIYNDVNLLTPYSMTSNVSKRFEAGIKIEGHYFNFSSIALATPEEIINFISADQYNRPIRRAGADMAEHTTVYFYEFGHQGSVLGDNDGIAGTGHAEDVYYLFNYLPRYLFRENVTLNAVDTAVSEKLVLLWSNFAKYGNPTPERDERLDNVIWNPVDSSSENFTYMSINETLVESVNPKQSDWEFYTDLWNEYGTGDEITTY